MFGLGPTELVLILALVLIIFGAGKLPQVFSSLGKGVKEFRVASEDPTYEPVKAEIPSVAVGASNNGNSQATKTTSPTA